MSGVEFIVGVVLGSVPITITIIEKYGVFAERLSVFCRPTGALKRSLTAVQAQRCIFWHSAVDLLLAITDNQALVNAEFSELTQQARRRIRGGDDSPQLPARQMATELRISTIYLGRISSLEASFQTCKALILQINEQLESLVKKIADMSKSIDVDITVDEQPPPPSGEWFSRARRALRVAYREPGITKDTDKLCGLISMFEKVTDNIIASLDKIKNGVHNNRYEYTWRTASNINRIGKYQQIRDASTALYNTLAHSWSCEMTDHENHTARVCCVDFPETKVAESVKLKLALTFCEVPEDATLDVNDPLWLEVEHCLSVQTRSDVDSGLLPSERSPNLTQDLIDNLALRTEQLATEHMSKKATRTVRFGIQSDNSQNGESSSRGNTNTTESPVSGRQSSYPDATPVNLRLLSNVCNHFHLQYTSSRPQQCLGYLDGQYQQRFYRVTPDQITNGRSMTLSDIISWVNDRPLLKFLPDPTVFHIARSLAASVLQFHSTPWLPKTWRSRDITFFGIGELSIEKDLPLSSPHFKVEFGKRRRLNKGKGKATAFTPEQPDPDDGRNQIILGARNELLFRLGIVLMEIAFSLPWEELREQTRVEFEIHKLPPGDQTEYAIAERLCEFLLLRRMGLDYTCIVRQCLGCHFPLETPEKDLGTSDDLQTAFLSLVVDKLQRMKNDEVPGLVTAGTF